MVYDNNSTGLSTHTVENTKRHSRLPTWQDRPLVSSWCRYNCPPHIPTAHHCNVTTPFSRPSDCSAVVSVSPSIRGSEDVSPLTVMEGSLITLVCESSGIPPPSLTWRKDGTTAHLRGGLRVCLCVYVCVYVCVCVCLCVCLCVFACV